MQIVTKSVYRANSRKSKMEVDQENNEINHRSRKASSNIRKQRYHELLNKLEGIQETQDVGINTVKELGHIFKEVTNIDNQCDFKGRVEYADETLLEHKVLSSSSGILVKCFEKADMFTSNYEANDFALKLVDALKESDEFQPSNWLKLLETARSAVPSLTKFAFLYGTFDPTKVPEPKDRKERPKREVHEQAPKVQLECVHDLNTEEQGMQDIENFLKNVLSTEYEKNGKQPLNYLDFVIDSSSFGTTVENIFYTSFLVRDGKAKLDIDGNCATIQPMRKRDLTTFRQKGGENTQLITSITMEDWEVLRIKDGLVQIHKNMLQSKS